MHKIAINLASVSLVAAFAFPTMAQGAGLSGVSIDPVEIIHSDVARKCLQNVFEKKTFWPGVFRYEFTFTDVPLSTLDVRTQVAEVGFVQMTFRYNEDRTALYQPIIDDIMFSGGFNDDAFRQQLLSEVIMHGSDCFDDGDVRPDSPDAHATPALK